MRNRSLARRLERLEAVIKPPTEPREFVIKFIGSNKEVVSTLIWRGDHEEWRYPGGRPHMDSEPASRIGTDGT